LFCSDLLPAGQEDVLLISAVGDWWTYHIAKKFQPPPQSPGEETVKMTSDLNVMMQKMKWQDPFLYCSAEAAQYFEEICQYIRKMINRNQDQ
jgi:hypothetical protein